MAARVYLVSGVQRRADEGDVVEDQLGDLLEPPHLISEETGHDLVLDLVTLGGNLQRRHLRARAKECVFVAESTRAESFGLVFVHSFFFACSALT